MATPLETEAPKPILTILARQESGLPHSLETDARSCLEALLYNKRYQIISRDHQNPSPVEKVAPLLRYHLVDAKGPSHIVLVGSSLAFQQIFLKSLDTQIDEVAPSSSFTTIIMITPAGLRAVVGRANGLQHDILFPDERTRRVETPTSIASKERDGKDKPQPNQQVDLSVVLLDIALVDTKAPKTDAPIGAVNFFPVSPLPVES